MENEITQPEIQGAAAPAVQPEIPAAINTPAGLKTINLSGDRFVVASELPGVFCGGVQYYDLKNIGYINYNGMANLIDFLKSLLKDGIEVKFVNVNDNIKAKIKSIGLEHILTCV